MLAGPTSAAAPASQTWPKGHSFGQAGLTVVGWPPVVAWGARKLTATLDGPNGPDFSWYRRAAIEVVMVSHPFLTAAR